MSWKLKRTKVSVHDTSWEAPDSIVTPSGAVDGLPLALKLKNSN